MNPLCDKVVAAIDVLIVILASVFIFSLTIQLVACGGSKPEVALSTAVDAVGATVSPISLATKQTCVARQDAELNAVRSGTKTAEEANKSIDKIRLRCNGLRDVFDRIRRLHSEAVDLINAKAYEQAKVKLKEIADAWYNLKSELGP